VSFASKSVIVNFNDGFVSFTPGFSQVLQNAKAPKPFKRFPTAG